MGFRGPAPTPTPILKSRGSGLVNKRQSEPTLPLSVPSCPSFLKGEARAEWNRQIKALLAMRVITQADRAALAVWCQAWDDFVRVTKALEGKNPWGKGQSRLVWVRKDAIATLLKFSAQFGFTPAARARLSAPEVQNAGDPMEKLLANMN